MPASVKSLPAIAIGKVWQSAINGTASRWMAGYRFQRCTAGIHHLALHQCLTTLHNCCAALHSCAAQRGSCTTLFNTRHSAPGHGIQHCTVHMYSAALRAGRLPAAVRQAIQDDVMHRSRTRRCRCSARYSCRTTRSRGGSCWASPWATAWTGGCLGQCSYRHANKWG